MDVYNKFIMEYKSNAFQQQLPQQSAMQNVYGFQPAGHLTNVPLWSRPYSYCNSLNSSCVGETVHDFNCLSMQFPLACKNTVEKSSPCINSCLCSDAILGPR